ncbi:MAG: tetratricopeptide repeat protein [Spirochaetaceae bacterium]|nr:tetratricopeptide repeat protein [Spirochaetaceae bacterium]
MRTSIRSKKQTKKTGRNLVIPTSTIILLIALLALFKGAAGLNQNLTTQIDSVDISLIWESGDYDRIIELTEQELEENPLDTIALIYCGFSYFYKGVSQVSNERAIPLLDRAIFLLRKVLVQEDVPMKSRIYYILGKAYLHKNYYYSDLAVFYLGKSIEDGYVNDDSFEYMGQAYSLLGDYNQSINFYLKALEINATDMLYLKISEDYIRNRMYDESEKYLKLMIDTTRDELLKKKGLFQLANLYYDMKNYSRAETVLLELIGLEKGNENYHFLLGEVYFFLNDIPKARSEWHKTARINPKHVGALRRLYG